MRSTLVVALTGMIALSANAPSSTAGNASHSPTAKSAVVRAPKGTLGFHMSTTPQRHPVLASRSRLAGERHYGAVYYHPRYGAYYPHYGGAYYRADYGSAYYEPDYGTAYPQPSSPFSGYAPADPDAVLGTPPALPPMPAADAPPHRVVQFPVTIFYEYHPHWTVNPF
jgi:hypothetical protein